ERNLQIAARSQGDLQIAVSSIFFFRRNEVATCPPRRSGDRPMFALWSGDLAQQDYDEPRQITQNTKHPLAECNLQIAARPLGDLQIAVSHFHRMVATCPPRRSGDRPRVALWSGDLAQKDYDEPRQ